MVYEVREEVKSTRTIDLAAFVRDRIRMRGANDDNEVNDDTDPASGRRVRARTTQPSAESTGDEDSQL